MNTYIKNEFKRVFFSKNALIVFLLTILLFNIAFYQGFGIITKQLKELCDALDIFIFAREEGVGLLAPLLASFIFSDSYLLDYDSTFLNFIYLRISKRKYVLTKILVNAIVSGLVVVLAYCVIFGGLIILFGLKKTSLQPLTGPFSYIFYKSKILYFVLLLIVSFIFNVIFATFSLGLSPWIKNRYLTILSSFFYYILSATLLNYIGTIKLDSTILFNLNPAVSELNIILYQVILLTLGVLLFYFGVLWKNEKNN